MKAYLSHFSALQHLPLRLAQEYFATEIAAAPAVEVTVFKEKHRYRRKGHRVHYCSLKVPSKYKTYYNGKAVVSPELLFLQLAETLTLLQSIMLGMLLCSKPDGPLSVAQTTQKKLQTCARTLVGHRGRPQALRALKYVKDNSGSIMEVLLGMSIFLPNLLGGYAFKGCSYNPPIKLNSECRVALGKDYLYPDICFQKEKVILEYQGEYHNSEPNIDHDSARIMALKRMGYTVILVTKSQLNDLHRFKQLILYLAKLLKRRIRIRTPKFAGAMSLIRALFPRARRRSVLVRSSPYGRLVTVDYPEFRALLGFLHSFRVPCFARAP
jgi:hypothetical protein